MAEPPAPDGAAPEREPEDASLKKLLLFQFAVISGLFALGVPGLAVVDENAEVKNLLVVYPPALLIHAFCLWRLWSADHRLLPWVQGFVLVVVALPWIAWGLRHWLGIAPEVSGPILFVAFVLLVIARANRKAPA